MVCWFREISRLWDRYHTSRLPTLGKDTSHHRKVHKSQQVWADDGETAPHREERHAIQSYSSRRAHTPYTARQFRQGGRLELEAGGADGGRAAAVSALGHDFPQLVGDAGPNGGKMAVQFVGPGSRLLWRVCGGGRPGLMSGLQSLEPGP